MGLFSNLFGGGKDTDAAKRFVNDLLKNVQNTQSPAQQPSPPPAPCGFSTSCQQHSVRFFVGRRYAVRR